MKLYTNEIQTAKLIELGFEEPKSLTGDYNITDNGDMESIEMKCAYSIGELIGFLPEKINLDGITHDRVISNHEVLYYSWIFEVYLHIFDKNDELIDNLFDACVKLKENNSI